MEEEQSETENVARPTFKVSRRRTNRKPDLIIKSKRAILPPPVVLDDKDA